jgi:hypothetical protein
MEIINYWKLSSDFEKLILAGWNLRLLRLGKILSSNLFFQKTLKSLNFKSSNFSKSFPFDVIQITYSKTSNKNYELHLTFDYIKRKKSAYFFCGKCGKKEKFLRKKIFTFSFQLFSLFVFFPLRLMMTFWLKLKCF